MCHEGNTEKRMNWHQQAAGELGALAADLDPLASANSDGNDLGHREQKKNEEKGTCIFKY